MARQIDLLKNGYSLIQDDNFFKLGQDSVMLSNFVKLRKNMKIFDLGCGTGVIMLLLALQKDNIYLDGIEIQPEVFELAQQNINLNNLQDRAKLYNGDMRNAHRFVAPNTYDLVVSNPPYFKAGCGIETESVNKKIARFENELTLDDVCKSAKRLLKFGGKFALVHKPERLCEITTVMSRNNIIPKRICFVHNKISMPPSTVLIEGRLGSADGVRIEPPIILNEEQNVK